MDYDPINIAPPGLEQGNYFPTEPGEYDRWAVEFAYKPDLTVEERAKLLALSVLPAYTYGTDGDAMGTPGRNIDPRAKRGDMSNDVVTYTADRFITLDNKIAELPEIYSDEGETKNDFTSSFYSLVGDKGRFMDIVAGNIGENSKLKPTNSNPVNMYFGDFDNNSTLEHIITYFKNGNEFPISNKDEITKQLNYLNRNFLYYNDFAGKENHHPYRSLPIKSTFSFKIPCLLFSKTLILFQSPHKTKSV
jgi:hypothetical protein